MMLMAALSPWGDAAATGRLTDIRIEHRTAEPDLVRVYQGDIVTLRWLTDEPVTLHLHGYDIELAVTPSKAEEMTFEAFATGRFPVEAHQFGGSEEHHDHGGEEKTLLYLEVLPE
ncbi:MAG: hypothetical protein CMM50_08745 [Rhodospirillaceae bacterium]|nr:hypothetical protein [Rhodospirillaceae bacterium]